MTVPKGTPQEVSDRLVEGLKASRDVGSRFVLFGLNKTIREVLQLSKLLRIFEVYDDEEQAVAP